MNRNIFIILPTFITAVILISLNSCNPSSEKKLNKPNVIEVTNYGIYTLDGCEYVKFGHGNFSWGSHKGNCSNPIHKEQSSGVDTLEIDDNDYYTAPAEKHFDCVVDEAIIERRDNPPYAYVTECGILFYSDVKYKVGDVLKNFKSGKHK
jgi:hypothetical protein